MISVYFAHAYWLNPRKNGANSVFACAYLLSPSKSVQTDSTIEFAIVENPQNHLRSQKYHFQKKTWAPGIQPNYIAQMSEITTQKLTK